MVTLPAKRSVMLLLRTKITHKCVILNGTKNIFTVSSAKKFILNDLNSALFHSHYIQVFDGHDFFLFILMAIIFTEGPIPL